MHLDLVCFRSYVCRGRLLSHQTLNSKYIILLHKAHHHLSQAPSPHLPLMANECQVLGSCTGLALPPCCLEVLILDLASLPMESDDRCTTLEVPAGLQQCLGCSQDLDRSSISMTHSSRDYLDQESSTLGLRGFWITQTIQTDPNPEISSGSKALASLIERLFSIALVADCHDTISALYPLLDHRVQETESTKP